MHLGAVGYLAEPITMRELEQAVKTHLRLRPGHKPCTRSATA